MQLTKDALELLQKTAQEAQAYRVVQEVTDAGDGRSATVQIGDRLETLAIPPGVRSHRVCDLANLMAYARNLIAVAEDAPRPSWRPVIWHGMNQVVLVLDDEDRRDVVELPLMFSTQFETLRELEAEPRAFDQRSFIRLLRTKLRLDPSMVAPFRRLDWHRSDEGSGDVQHGKDRLGKQIEAKVQAIDALPEDPVFHVPVYNEMGEREAYAVQCALEIDTLNQKLGLIPLPGELDVAIDRAQESIHTRLCEEFADEIPIYYGNA